jgi:hypothetical protein
MFAYTFLISMFDGLLVLAAGKFLPGRCLELIILFDERTVKRLLRWSQIDLRGYPVTLDLTVEGRA